VRPLEDVRIIAVEQYGAGPFGSVHLADLGAEVIKIEDAREGGDIARYIPPFQEDEDSLFFETFNRNKKSLSLDLSTTAGKEVLRNLVAVSDAVYSNLRGDLPAKLGIRYDDLRDINPRIVCCSLTGFGMTGPRSAEPAYDYILQGLAGWMTLTGEPDAPPTKSGLSLVDYCGGFTAALALVTGLHAARRDGVGMDCDLSLFDVAVNLLTYVATWQLTANHEVRRTSHSAHPSLVPFQNFQTADGWIVVGCAKEKFWRRLTVILGRPEFGEDERFRTFEARGRNAGVLLPALSALFVTKPSAYWLERLGEAGVPSGPINTVAQALADPQVLARDMIVSVEHPRFGIVRETATPVNVGDTKQQHRRAPQRNEDADAILGTLLHYDADRVSQLRSSGAFGPTPEAEPLVSA
jgi:crotonobetainyl-CoA:carnitine CoA-transferase CaiB-like acyl-CoA transferase